MKLLGTFVISSHAFKICLLSPSLLFRGGQLLAQAMSAVAMAQYRLLAKWKYRAPLARWWGCKCVDGCKGNFAGWEKRGENTASRGRRKCPEKASSWLQGKTPQCVTHSPFFLHIPGCSAFSFPLLLSHADFGLAYTNWNSWISSSRYDKLLERRQDRNQKERDPSYMKMLKFFLQFPSSADNFGGIPAARHILAVELFLVLLTSCFQH